MSARGDHVPRPDLHLRRRALHYGLYFYFSWLPTYLITVLGFSLLGGGLFAALPFLLAGIADVVGGRLTDHLARAGPCRSTSRPTTRAS